ncbi:expressed unknown protein [Seminavis robusta]|uniref:NAD-dependent epimerase/dehydratase domain-containing protein n=1 Tax=Seminavis robusta TaxID=568900 RepID=A0A9N8HGZ1_9STRA|nr:expressed unknown protein [Seminavis robusta]|eukprot:Sro604_g174180.1 n/a (298) ;mRNA; f:41454-42578
MAASQPSQQQCAVIGCGVLGTSLCKQLLASPDFEGWTVTGITKTTNNHASILEAVGEEDTRFQVTTMEESQGKTFDNVVFCAPPSGFDDYGAAVEHAVTNVWSGLDHGGTFVFTSSGGIHGPGTTTEPETITEETPTADPESSPRTARLIKAEEACRAHGGCCVRLAGLYTLERGAHSFWLNSGKDVSGRADGIINLLHYDDAASAALAALTVGSNVVKGRNFLVSDSHPLTRQQICSSAMKADLFKDKKMPAFLGKDTEPIGKLYDGTVSERDLQWKPKYESFDAFMSMHAAATSK